MSRVVLRIAAADEIGFNCGLQLNHRASTGNFSKQASAVPALLPHHHEAAFLRDDSLQGRASSEHL